MERAFLVRSGDRTGLPVTISRFLPAAPLFSASFTGAAA